MTSTRTNGLSIFAILSVAGVLLTGCSSSDGAGETSAKSQSVKEACSILIEGVTEMETSITENAAELQSDPAAADAAFTEFIDLYNENSSKVTNTKVKATADKIGAVFTDIGEARAAAASDPENVDQEAMNTIATDLQAATSELDEICGAA
jgi:hypothetical protein